MTEAEMCAAFTARARARGFLVYPETGGFDLLLVWGGEAPLPSLMDRRNEPECSWDSDWVENDTMTYPPEYMQGDQIGIEAKVKPGLPVLSQLVNRYRHRVGPTSKGPDFFAILTLPGPRASDMQAVCRALGIGVYEFHPKEAMEPVVFPRKRHHFGGGSLWVPPVEPSFDGGHPGPRTLSYWRVGALRIMAILRARGWVTSEDFKAAGIAKGAWVTRRWIESYSVPGENRKRYRIVPDESLKRPREGIWQLPDAGYETERDAIAERDATP